MQRPPPFGPPLPSDAPRLTRGPDRDRHPQPVRTSTVPAKAGTHSERLRLDCQPSIHQGPSIHNPPIRTQSRSRPEGKMPMAAPATSNSPPPARHGAGSTRWTMRDRFRVVGRSKKTSAPMGALKERARCAGGGELWVVVIIFQLAVVVGDVFLGLLGGFGGAEAEFADGVAGAVERVRQCGRGSAWPGTGRTGVRW